MPDAHPAVLAAGAPPRLNDGTLVPALGLVARIREEIDRANGTADVDVGPPEIYEFDHPALVSCWPTVGANGR